MSYINIVYFSSYPLILYHFSPSAYLLLFRSKRKVPGLLVFYIFLTTNNYFQRDIFWQNFSIMDSWERVTNLKQKAFFLAPIRWRDHGNIKWALLAILLLPLKTVSLSPLTHSNSKRRRQIISRGNIQMSHAFQSLNFGTCAFLI